MKRAFTLIEVLVVTAVIALLAGLLLPALAQARNQGRRAVCLANLRQLAIATTGYLDENRDYFWRYYVDSTDPKGRSWWFGFEPNGPGSGKYRPLDKTRAALARYLRSTDNGLQCPSFPYEDGLYFPKFAARSASYGYNLLLGTPHPSRPTRRRAEFRNRSARVFVFADGVHFDFNPGINEGHYIEYAANPASLTSKTGYAHFRHNRRAQVLFLDGHADALPLRGPTYPALTPAGPAGNLTGPNGGRTLYGD
ncbi:MAG TPA: prepilin-type N-terminal cleavage/methylation domain-containing protein [Phycisphaerae bacterium]|jgi:prepilin-type N-terminal cleavage/methylation domain-containing protein/prepilin-type processing-associated H-X9-DG protein|nr:prepilin-type N-terminal cleavage/methylation domain-containing protein [Phycisphaerae bacterium]HOB76041.1 prepilin-type N-terminal cleavage/methylation domain-containing protein [Phycisphaerae bacterium]HOJ54442.1 prepilin-type N-terminal cleavage/methylation domain-containing protein [Phycisphaerae bacterium]HOL26243.1 prepilin-type N-terminal cleavage/methylation domain-containing protein [Phycisphaerae bacterium]HPP20768.1 prepilin-type N-terminal cleavage/methylation domain-containing 